VFYSVTDQASGSYMSQNSELHMDLYDDGALILFYNIADSYPYPLEKFLLFPLDGKTLIQSTHRILQPMSYLCNC